MARHKTIDLVELIQEVNRRNACSICKPTAREGWNSLLETMLMKADVYAGFNNLRASELQGDAIGQPPGIIFDQQAINEGRTPNHQFPDDSRRVYYVHRSLRPTNKRGILIG